jgi:hypothetical protein
MNNLTLVDKNGNRIECECTWVQRFTSRPGGSKRVVLTFEDSQTAKDVFSFVWEKAMGRQIDWRKGTKRTKGRVSPSPELAVGD